MIQRKPRAFSGFFVLFSVGTLSASLLDESEVAKQFMCLEKNFLAYGFDYRSEFYPFGLGRSGKMMCVLVLTVEVGSIHHSSLFD